MEGEKEMDILEWLQEWYKSNCDGDWEHLYGTLIDTLDNSGWSVKIDLLDTDLEDKYFAEIRYDNGDGDWMFCKVKDGKFNGDGDSNKLKDILLIFRDWAESEYD